MHVIITDFQRHGERRARPIYTIIVLEKFHCHIHFSRIIRPHTIFFQAFTVLDTMNRLGLLHPSELDEQAKALYDSFYTYTTTRYGER